MNTRVFRGIATTALFLAGALVLSPARSYGQEARESSRKVLNRVSPECPEIARRMRIAGVVKAEVLVTPNGTVKNIAIKGGHPLLAKAAQMAILKWKWEPTPHETRELLEIRFNNPD
jgi:TonB family protein